MEQEQKEKRGFGFFRKRPREGAPVGAPAGTPVEAPAEQAPIPPAPAAPDAPCSLEVSADSALWKLWEQWRGDQAELPPPSLTLAPTDDGAPLPVSRPELEREGRILLTALELCAKDRLKACAHEEEAGVPDLDCVCFVHAASSRMAAWAMVLPPLGGGQGPSLAVLGDALQKAGITTGLLENGVTALATDSTRFFVLRPVAVATPPREGKNGTLVEKFERQNIRKVQTDDQGNIDYRAQTYVRAIRRGDIICDILPPEPGRPGVRIDGKVLEPQPVRPAATLKGTNTEVSEDGRHLIASMDGHVEFSGGAFQVRPALVIQGDVDYSTGNIDYPGDVHVRGDVRENFTVRATGKVTIDGLVEGACVDAGGDVVISKGVLGNNKAVIKSKRLVRAMYLENCVVYSGDCTYADCIIASQIYSDSKISVTTGRGTIIGGRLIAGEQVECFIMGSKADRETTVILGQLPCTQEELKTSKEKLRLVQAERSDLELNLAYLEERVSQGALTPKEETELARVRLRLPVLALKEERLTKRRAELLASQTDLSACRLICDTVYPTTKLIIGAVSRVIDMEWRKFTAYYSAQDHEIHIT